MDKLPPENTANPKFPLYFRAAVNARLVHRIRCHMYTACFLRTPDHHDPLEMSATQNAKPIHLGPQPFHALKPSVSGKEVTLDGETYYKISAVDRMRPFFMSIVSHSDHWMFLSSNGGLSAGRKNSDFALFPYYTDDKITEAAETTGSKTVVLVEGEDRRTLWLPFS